MKGVGRKVVDSPSLWFRTHEADMCSPRASLEADGAILIVVMGRVKDVYSQYYAC